MSVSMLPLMAALVLNTSEASTAMFNEQVDDYRVQHVVYTDKKVVKIAAIVNQPFLIEFRDEDSIDDVAGGSIAGWDVHKKAYRLYVRALGNAERTTLIVSAHKHSYVFDLVRAKNLPANFDKRPSKIVIENPPPPPPSMPNLTDGVDNSNKPAVVLPPPPPPEHNYNYTMQIVTESADIRPIEVFDNGRFTWFRFSANAEIPAIYKSRPNTKDEILVDSHMEGDYIVMHSVAPLWNLRLAQSMIGVFNESFQIQGNPPQSGTTVYGLVRESKQ